MNFFSSSFYFWFVNLYKLSPSGSPMYWNRYQGGVLLNNPSPEM